MIKAVIFDLDGTLYDYDSGHERGMEALFRYGENILDTDRDTFQKTYDEANRRMAERIGAVCAAIHNRMIRFEYMLEILKKPLFPYAMELYHTYWDAFLDGMVPEDGIVSWMNLLKRQKLRIGIGTNMTAYIQYRKLERLGLTSQIDWIVTSEEVNCEKPERRFFDLCVEKSGVLPEECLFVGDTKQSDILGALRAGMHALYYEPEKKIRTEQSAGTQNELQICEMTKQCVPLQPADALLKERGSDGRPADALPEEREEKRYVAITSYHRCLRTEFLNIFESI